MNLLRIFAGPPRPKHTRSFALLAAFALVVACSDGPSAAPKGGSLVVNINGLPPGSHVAARVTGPDGSLNFSRDVSATDTLRGLAPGIYVVAAQEVVADMGTYHATVETQQVQVQASSSPASVGVAFEITTGSIAVQLNGLPAGTPGATQITGSGGYSRLLTTSQTLRNLQPGTYLISSSSVTVGSGHVYSPTPLAQSVGVVASETPKNATASYALSTGALNVVIAGLPLQQNANVTIVGPAGFSRQLGTSQTITGIYPGTYTVIAEDAIGGSSYRATVPTQTFGIAASLTPAQVQVTYVDVNQPSPPGFNITIPNVYVTQAVQSPSGMVPLIANVPALVRVFLKGSAPNLVNATVRLQVFHGTALQQTLTLMPNVPGVPDGLLEGTLAASWNAVLPGPLVQPGLRLVAEADPLNEIAEASESDNRFPAAGAVAPAVEVPPPLNLTVVPVRQSATGLTGNVSSANVDAYLEFVRKVMPIRDYRVTVRTVFTTDAPELTSNDGNNGWFYALGDVNALRVAEGSPDLYLGVLKTTYNSGTAGLAFTPGKTAVAWDLMPNAPRIAAHELGHTFGRRHAPCGGVTTPDPEFPIASGSIGVYGYDASTGALLPPQTSDLMGYCGFGWISDYTYKGILAYRATAQAISQRTVASFTGGKGPSLIVWGHIVDGKPVLEPAFSATTVPVLPARTGPYRVEGRASDGRILFSYAFEAEEPADMPGKNLRHFAFAIPMSDADALQIARIILTTTAGERSELAITNTSGMAAVEATRESGTAVRFRVSDPSTRLAVVRDRATGRIVAFVRGGGKPVSVRSAATEFEVQLSDGVRSRVRTVTPGRR